MFLLVTVGGRKVKPGYCSFGWGVISRFEENRFNAVLNGQGTAGFFFRSLFCREPIGIFSKAFPGSIGGLATFVSQDINQGVISALLFIKRRPIAEVGHAVLLEEGEGVVAEAGMEVFQMAGGGSISAQLETARL